MFVRLSFCRTRLFEDYANYSCVLQPLHSCVCEPCRGVDGYLQGLLMCRRLCFLPFPLYEELLYCFLEKARKDHQSCLLLSLHSNSEVSSPRWAHSISCYFCLCLRQKSQGLVLALDPNFNHVCIHSFLVGLMAKVAKLTQRFSIS